MIRVAEEAVHITVRNLFSFGHLGWVSLQLVSLLTHGRILRFGVEAVSSIHAPLFRT